MCVELILMQLDWQGENMDKMPKVSDKELNTLHNASMRILKKIGIAFHEPKAIEIFKKHSVKTDNNIVFLTESQIENALASTPQEFTINAPNPQNNVRIGGEYPVFAPVLGTAFIVSRTGVQTKASMKDHDNLCKLVQTSEFIDMNGSLMVTPWDVIPETAHLHILLANMTLCDKAFIGCSLTRRDAIDAIEMGSILWGGKDRIRNFPIAITLISALSPLQYPAEVAGALIELSRYGQPLIMTGSPKAGTTGPVSLAGTLALHNAQILAGIALAQLVNPGTPIAYGGISGPADLKTGNILYGAPELSKATAAIAQMAKYYNLPSRSGGALTDAHLPDIQAGIESTLALLTAARSGIHLISYTCGMLGSFLSLSLEKFLIDEELCGKVRNLLKPITITDEEIDFKTIEEAGIGGEYLTAEKTLERCRTEYFSPKLMTSQIYDVWKDAGMKRLEEKASEAVEERLAAYKKPSVGRDVERALERYVSEVSHE